jgi:cell division topological specificity factor
VAADRAAVWPVRLEGRGQLMSSFFDRFKGKREPTSAEIAKERLQLVLVSDRSHLSPDKLEAMQIDILMVIKRYIDIDDLDVQIKFEQRDRKHYLVADIPLNPDHSYEADAASDADELESDADTDTDSDSDADDDNDNDADGEPDDTPPVDEE